MTTKPPIALLLSDVDGTLVDPRKALTPRAVAAVRSLGERGIGFAITSGRPPRGMAMLIEPLALRLPLAAFNGGALVRPDLSVIETHGLGADTARAASERLRAMGLDVWLFTDEEWQVRDADAPRVRHEQWTVRFAPRVVPEFSEQSYARAIKVSGVSDDFPLVEHAERELGAALSGRASVSRSQSYYLDITHPQANKGEVVAELARACGIAAGSIATIGDMQNDVLMFRESGFSIAMGNASDAVKAQADAVTDSFEHDGFAKAVERYFLEEHRDT